MEGEANRVLQLTANAVVPISYIVPRKVSIFHSLFFIFWHRANIFFCV